MKKIVYSLIFLLSASVASAQNKDEMKVARAVETLKKAMIDGDRQELEAIAAEKLSYGHSSGKVQNKSEFVEAIVSGQSDFVSIDLTDQSVAVSKKTALVRHKLTAKTNDNGNSGNVSLYILLVFQKQHGDWKLLARQAVKVPQ